MPDLELDSFKRSINLAEYAIRSDYQLVERESGAGVVVLRDPRTEDRIAVGRSETGDWAYASLASCAPRGESEPHDHARGRIRDHIAHTADKGSIVEFVKHRERVANWPEPSLDDIRRHLHRSRLSPPPALTPEHQAQLRACHTILDRQRQVELSGLPPPAPQAEHVTPRQAGGGSLAQGGRLQTLGSGGRTELASNTLSPNGVGSTDGPEDAARQRIDRLKHEHPQSYADLERRFEQVRSRTMSGVDLRRTINVVDYARAAGYEQFEQHGGSGITLLEHPGTRDKIAVARAPGGDWMYAAIPDYAPRDARETDGHAERRLRDCIARSPSQGFIEHFVHYRGRIAGRGEVSPDLVRQHLRAWHEAQRSVEPPIADKASPALPLDKRIGDWKPSPPTLVPSEAEVRERLKRWHDAQAVVERKLGYATELASAHAPSRSAHRAHSPPQASGDDAGRAALSPQNREALNRRYDWSPPASPQPALPPATRSLRGRDQDRGR